VAIPGDLDLAFEIVRPVSSPVALRATTPAGSRPLLAGSCTGRTNPIPCCVMYMANQAIGNDDMAAPVYRELIAASSRPMVLSILAGGESYGYQMLKQVKLLSGGSVDWSDGMLYPVLHRLERDGLIAGRWQLTDAGRRRKYYRLTDRGKRQLSRDRASWRTLTTALEAAWGEAHV